MKTRAVRWLATGLFLAGVFVSARAVGGPEPKSSYTLENLQVAYTDEVNVADRYGRYAQKADEEGYPSVASLFRAAARAETVHADNHAAIIKRLGGVPKSFPIQVEVGSTQENLRVVSLGEFFEWQKMYPTFIQQAQEENILEPVRTLTYARNAENQHATLFAGALKDLESWKKEKQTYFVCPVCGYVAGSLPKERCPSCSAPSDKFMKVS